AASLALATASCTGHDEEAAPTAAGRGASSSSTTASGTVAPQTVNPMPLPGGTAPTATTAITTSTTGAPTSSPATEVDVAALASDALQALAIGRSVQGRPIVAVERGTPGGAVVLVIGVIHGDEDDGVAIVERLATAPVPAAVDLWLIESMNPDGQVVPQRWNAA